MTCDECGLELSWNYHEVESALNTVKKLQKQIDFCNEQIDDCTASLNKLLQEPVQYTSLFQEPRNEEAIKNYTEMIQMLKRDKSILENIMEAKK